MRYRVLHDRRAPAGEQWVVVDARYGRVMAYFGSEAAAERAALALERA